MRTDPLPARQSVFAQLGEKLEPGPDPRIGGRSAVRGMPVAVQKISLF